MFFWSKSVPEIDENRPFIRKNIISSYELWLDRSLWVLGVRSWNLNWNQIWYYIFVFCDLGNALSSRSPAASRDRDATRQMFKNVACKLWLDSSLRVLGVRNWNLNWNQIWYYIFVFYDSGDALSSRSPAASRDRDITREVIKKIARKLWLDRSLQVL